MSTGDPLSSAGLARGLALQTGTSRRALDRQGVALLKTMPLFAELPRRHLRRLAGLAEQVRFGAGRTVVQNGSRGTGFYVIVEGTAKVTVGYSNRPKLAPMYTPGFAAPEQYRDPDRLGPWTDVYGTGASMFACLAAFAPQAADARTQEDHLVPAKKIWAGQYSDNLLEVIDWCLRLDPLERPQSVFALQQAIRDIPPKKRKLTLLGSLKRRLFSVMSA